jgi:hypothetical protein
VSAEETQRPASTSQQNPPGGTKPVTTEAADVKSGESGDSPVGSSGKPGDPGDDGIACIFVVSGNILTNGVFVGDSADDRAVAVRCAVAVLSFRRIIGHTVVVGPRPARAVGRPADPGAWQTGLRSASIAGRAVAQVIEWRWPKRPSGRHQRGGCRCRSGDRQRWRSCPADHPRPGRARLGHPGTGRSAATQPRPADAARPPGR